MPQAIPAIVSWVGTALWSASWVTVAKIALVVGSTIYSRNQAKKAQRAFASLRDQGTSVTFSDPMAVAALVYGECRIGGVVIHAETTGASNNFLHQVIALAPHDLSEIDDIYFGDEALGMPWNSGSPSNVPDVTSSYYGKTRINRKIGGGSADSELVAESGGGWTSTDKMTGVASIYVRTQWDVDVFPQGLSFNISTDVKGKECYDTRDASTAYTNNNALVLRDFLVEHLGYPAAEVDSADVNAAANICDESVTIADSTSQKRYTFNGRILTDTKPADARQMIARAMGGWCAKIGGKWRMEAGASKSSSLSLTPDDFIGEIEWLNQDPISEACNAVRVTYLDPKNNWQPATAPLVRKIVTAPNITAGARCTIVSLGTTNFTLIGAASNTVGLTFTASGAGTGTGTVDPYLGEDNGVEHVRDIDLFGVTNEATALRLGRIELERARHGLTFTTQTGLKGLQVQAGDWVDVTFSRYGWSSKLFEVVEHRTVHEVQESGMFISIRLVLREVSSAIYSRTAADETTADPAPNTTLQNPRDVIAPVLGTLESDDDQLTIDSRGQVVSRIKVPWTCADAYVTSGGTFEIEYKLSADTDWLPAPIAPLKGSDEVAWIGPVVDGEDYDVRIRAVNGIGVHSDWDTETAHTVIGKSEDPNPATSLAAEAIPGGAILTWTEPTDLDIGEYWIYENTTNSIPADPEFKIAAPATSFTRNGLDAGDVYYWWVKAVDTSGNASTAAGSVTVTVLPSASPTYLFAGVYSASDTYYCNAEVVSIVKHSSSYYKASNAAKDGLATWGTPPTDWTAITWIPALAATDLLLAKDVVILKKLTMGDGATANAGIITDASSTSHTSGTGFHLNPRNSSYSNLATARFGSTSGYYIGFDGTTVDTVLKTFTLKPSASGVQFVIDTDSSFVGPNPPARMTFGTMQALNSGTATALNFSSASGSGIRWTGGTGFAIGESFVSTYQIDTTTGAGRFASIQIGSDCDLTRSSANTITTPDSLVVGGALQVNSTGNFTGALSASSLSTTAQATIGSYINLGSAVGSIINFHTDTVLYRSGANALRTGGALTVDGRIYIGTNGELYQPSLNVIRTPNGLIVDLGVVTTSVAVDQSGTYEFFAGAGNAAVYVRNQNFEVRDSGGTAKLSVLGASGNTSIAGTLSVASTLSVTGTSALGVVTTGTITATGAIATSGALTSGAAGTLYLGTDCEIARTSVNTLTTPDTFVALGLQTNGGDLLVYNGGDKCRIQASNGSILINSTLVVTQRQTGWGAPTGTLSRASFDPSTVSATTAYQVLAALVTDLRTHGLIGN